MRATRLTNRGLVAPPDQSIDFPPEGAIICGENGAGKSATIHLLSLMLGQTGQSLGSLLREGEDSCEAELYLQEGDTQYRLHRRSTKTTNKIDTQKLVDGAWVSLPPSGAEALARLFVKGCDPAELLKPQPDSKVVELILQVVPNREYDPSALLSEMGVTIDLDPMPRGLHVLDWMEKVEEQLCARRKAVSGAREAAAAVVERDARSLPAEPVPPSEQQLEASRLEAARLTRERDSLRQRVESAKREAYMAAENAFEIAVAAAEKARQAARDEANKLEAIALYRLPEMEQAIGSAEQAARDAQAAHNRHVADAALRAKLDEAREDEKRQADRLAAIQAMILRLRGKAAEFIGDALPGVRVSVDEKGRRFVEVDCHKDWRQSDPDHGACWVPWSSVNTARQMKIAAQWSTLMQQRGDRGVVSEAIVLLDRAESFDAKRFRELVSRGGQVICSKPTDGELRVEALP